MRWRKLGQVFQQKSTQSWRANSALTPTPFLLNEETIRVYAGFRDREGISRIGYVDLDALNPCVVKAVAKEPVLDIGRAGCFDDNGVILGDVINHKGSLRMYYIGFQQVKRAKFLAFTGVAESSDQGDSFIRLSEAPVLDRTSGATTIRAIHSVHYEQARWRVWYSAGDDWHYINEMAYPKYTIWYTESQDGLSFSQPGSLCIDPSDKEYRLGRPSVYRHGALYYMFYTRGSISGKDYYPGLAISTDGCNWLRRDADFGLPLSNKGFDSRHLCYPRLIQAHGKTYCVYNGNNMGFEGFGLAELLEW